MRNLSLRLDPKFPDPHHDLMKWSWIYLVLLGGCASLSTQLPDMDGLQFEKEQAQQARDIFSEIDKQRARFVAVADPILAKNVDYCEKTRPDIGLTLQSRDDYPEKLRSTAERELGLDETPRVVFVRPGSPADKAGVTKGAIIRLENGEALSGRDKALRKAIESRTPLIIEQDGQTMSMVFNPDIRCDYRLSLRMTSAINAYATGKSIVVTAGMMEFVNSDDELAYVIGHELAHNTHRHIRKSITNFILSGLAHRYTRPFEAEADYVGLYYAARAGFDLNNVEDIWRRLARRSLKPIYKAKTHPTFPNRAVLIETTRNEIQAKRDEGLDLIPNPRSKAGS